MHSNLGKRFLKTHTGTVTLHGRLVVLNHLGLTVDLFFRKFIRDNNRQCIDTYTFQITRT